MNALGIDGPQAGVAIGPAPAENQGRGFGFQPGLEGLRGVAVAVVLLFHNGFSWAVGGFLGVSTFFTLSGYLITSLLVAEHDRHGRIDLRRFWGRRFRRLMPASLVCLAGVVVFGATVATAGQLVDLRGDVFASMFYVANWRFIADGASYAALFGSPSPVLHFWSLAIEEQFYVVFPLFVAGILFVAKGSRKVLAGVVAVACVGSVTLCARLAATSIDAAYYNTFSRAAELLIGVLLALAMATPGVSRALRRSRATVVATTVGVAALVVCIVLWHRVDQTDGWLYRGGLAAYALLTVALIVGATRTGLLRSLFSARALRWLGRISYGVYLYHWPIFLWLTPLRTGLSQWPLFALRMAVTLAAALVSYHLIEQPIRSGRRITGWRPFVVAPLAVTVLALATLWVTANPPTGQLIRFDGAENPDAPDFVAAEAVAAPVPTTTPPELDQYVVAPAPALPPPPALRPGERPRLYLAGDSGAFTLGVGMSLWADDTGAAQVWNAGKLGCGVGRGGRMIYVEKERATFPECDVMPLEWFDAMRQHRPHVVAMMHGTWDTADRLLPGDDTWRAPGDPVYDRFLLRELTAAIDVLQGQGATVVLLTHPLIRTGITEQLPGPFPEAEPERMRRLNELLVEASALRPRTMVLDLAAHMAARPNGELDLAERPDGIHWTQDAARVLADWLGPQLLAVARGEPTDPGAIIFRS